ncbi:MAG: extensin family protein [Polyangiaceae bacterium]
MGFVGHRWAGVLLTAVAGCISAASPPPAIVGKGTPAPSATAAPREAGSPDAATSAEHHDEPEEGVVSPEGYDEYEEHELAELEGLEHPTAPQHEPHQPPPQQYPFHATLPAKEMTASSPAQRYASLSPGACRTELGRRKISAVRLGGNVPGIASPMRLPKELNGVRLIVPPKTTKWSMLDCRLVLALDDLTRLLVTHDVTAMAVGNFYRPWSKLRKRVKSQHHYGLAADIVSFTLKDGSTLDVTRDFQATVGEQACGPEAVMHEYTEAAVRLRNLMCDVARAKLFHHMLSPSFNTAHRDHFHWDIKREGYAVIVR